MSKTTEETNEIVPSNVTVEPLTEDEIGPVEVQELLEVPEMPEKKRIPLWKRILFSPVILGKSDAQKIAYIGVMTALCIVANFLEFKFADVQYSFTIFASVLTGILIGPVFGFVAAFLGDALAFLVHSGGFIYMPWVGLSVACMALIAGLVINLPFRFKGSCYVKLTIACVLTLIVCSVGINTTGMYIYYTNVGFTPKSLNLIAEHFGGKNMYLTYALVRLVFLGQLLNNVFNYVLLFVVVPLLKAIKPLKLELR